MQLKELLAALALVSSGSLAVAQSDTTAAGGEEKIQLEDIEVSFLGSYYQQDGNHSPVTGGVGTEKLDNTAPSLIIKVPLDTVRTIDFNGGIDVYSSASSDNINNPYNTSAHVSSASAQDARVYGTLGYKRKDLQKHTERGVSFGVSSEYDVLSLQLGVNWAKSSLDNNREFNVKLSYYFDDWKLIYPTELRNGTSELLPTDKRQTVNFSMTGSAVINQRMNVALTTDVVFQSGLLSTPFHRVFFTGEEVARIESLPDQRVKIPIGLRFHYHFSDIMMLRMWGRFYVDTWGMTGQTARIELPIKVGQAFRIYPFYRYHTQTAVDYFAPYLEHDANATFYTADYDLSGLSSQQYGLGISISPLYGLARFKRPLAKGAAGKWKSLDLRYAMYSRSDGLNASVVTLGAKFALGRAK